MTLCERAVGTIEQRLYDVFVRLGPGVPVRLYDVYSFLPYLHRRSVRLAVNRLCASGVVHRCRLPGIFYELVNGAQRPRDSRGWPKGKVRA